MDDGMMVEDGGWRRCCGGVIAAVLVPDWEGGCANGTCSTVCGARGVGDVPVVAEG